MRSTLDLRRLRYFLAIAENGSMSAAARALNLAQPALSYHVAELERLLGLSLFDRSRGGVSLTEPGKLLQRYAREIVSKADAAEAAMRGLARQRRPAARVRIALISSLAADLTPILLETVARERPEVILSISEAGTREIEQKLERAEADMAVYLASSHGQMEQPVATERLFLVAQASAASSDGPITLEEVSRQRLVLPAAGNPLRSFIESVMRQKRLATNVVLEVDGSRSRRNAVLSGIGSTILGAHSVASEGLDGRLCVREIVAPHLLRPIYLGVRRNFDPELTASISTLLGSALMALGLSAPQDG